MGDAHLTEQEKEEIATSSDFKEAADWLIAPSESLLLLGDSRCGLANTFSRPAYLPGPTLGLTFRTGISRLLPVSRCVCGCGADVMSGCFGIIYGVLAAPEREPPMRNLAGTGRAGWQLLGVDEEYGTPVMALDMTGGQVIVKYY